MEYTLETANRLAEELRAIPPKDPSKRRLDKQGMVRQLAQEIIALQQRGYTIEEVAESLRGRGLEITTPTLKNYLQRIKSAGDNKRPRAARQAAPKPARAGAPKGAMLATATTPTPQRAAGESVPRVPATHATSAAPEGVAPEPTLRRGKDAFLIKDKESY